MDLINIFWDVIRTFIIVGVIIFVHELGHFLMAKKVGIKVERFSIGFGPKLASFKRGDTEYRIAWFLIIGGYVKMMGENPADESNRKEVLEKGHFLAAPVSHRAMVALAGPGMNLIFAVFAIAMAYMVGLPSQLAPSRDTTIGYVEPNSPAAEAGITPGDRFISVAGYKVKVWGDIQENVAINPDQEIEIVLLRNETVTLNTKVKPERIEDLLFGINQEFQNGLDNKYISEDLIQEFKKNKISLSPDTIIVVAEAGKKWLITDGNREYHIRKESNELNIYQKTDLGRIGISPISKPIISSVEHNSAAEKTGFRADDVIEEINHKRVGHIIEFLNELPNAPGKPVVLTVSRKEGGTMELPLDLKYDESGQLISLGGLSFTKIIRLNPISAFEVAIPETVRMVGKIFQFLKRMIVRDVPMKYVAGPIGIMQLTMAVVKTGLAGILHFTGFLSVNLGIINLLPLFITDGGMIAFLVVEKLRGKRLSHKKQLIIQQVGIGFIILLFLLVTYNDVLRIIKGSF